MKGEGGKYAVSPGDFGARARTAPYTLSQRKSRNWSKKKRAIGRRELVLIPREIKILE